MTDAGDAGLSKSPRRSGRKQQYAPSVKIFSNREQPAAY